MSFWSSFHTPITVIRPFNTYGPRQSTRAVIPSIISQLASGQRSIKIGSVHPTRDFSFVADIVSGFLAALRSDRGIGEVINLGSNFEISIGETVKMISEVMGIEFEIVKDKQSYALKKVRWNASGQIIVRQKKITRLVSFISWQGRLSLWSSKDSRLVYEA